MSNGRRNPNIGSEKTIISHTADLLLNNISAFGRKINLERLINNPILQIMRNNEWKWFTHLRKVLHGNLAVRLILLLMVGINSSLCAKVYSQAERFNIQREASAKEIFNEIMQTSNYLFFYNNEFNDNYIVKLDVKNADINTVVEQVLKGKTYSYKLLDNYVIIGEQEAITTAQDNKATVRIINGVVKDKNGETLPGVSVVIKGSSWGVATDIDGKYNLAIPIKGATLVFSYIGKKNKEIFTGELKELNIVLEDGGEMLEEVVCTGIQTISRERATGSFDLLNADQLNKTLTSDVISRLDGKIAGVQIDQNNKMTIRGRGSIMSNTEPLVVVDGFPIETGISSVNPDDISNITVLKDAAAASIWGVRAANGVVVITTKSGAGRDVPTFNVSYTLTVDSKDQINDLHLMNASQSVDHQLEYIRKNWWQPTAAVNTFHLSVNKVQEAYYAAILDPNRPSDYDGIRNDETFKKELSRLRNSNLYEQFEQELLRRAVTNRVNLSLTGGGERSDYYISGVYDYQTQNVGEQNNNLLLNLKHNYKILESLTLSSSVNLQYELGENNGISTDYLMSEPAFHNLLDENGKRIQYYMVDPWAGKERESLGYLSYSNNWLHEQEQNDKTSDMFNARVMAALNWKISPSLNIETRFQYERGYSNKEELYSIAHPFMRRLINEYTLVKGDKLEHQFPVGAQFSQGTSNIEAWTWRNQLSYNKDWFEGTHRFTGVLGHEMRKYKTTVRNITQYGYDANNLNYIPIDESKWIAGDYNSWKDGAKLGLNLFNNYQEIDNRDVSVYVNGAYTFADKYSFTASGRVDQSNIFGNDSKYKYNVIWSTGVSWNIGRERFLQKKWIDQLVLRATYGIGGNVNKNFYPVLMGKNEVDSYTNNYIVLTNPANKNLKWETTNTINAGVDFGFVQGRIFGNLDYYYRKGNDLLGRVSLDPTNGFNSATMNFASLVNSGVELTLNGVLLSRDKFSWQVGMNISYNDNRVTKVENAGSTEMDYLYMAPSAGSGVAVKDKPLGRLYAYDYAGLDENGDPLLWQNGEKVHFAQYDRNSNNLKYMGTTEAPWFGGVNTAIEYKGLTLSANATFKFGHKFRLPVSDVSTSGNGYSNIADRWLKPGDEIRTIVPGLKDFAYSTAQTEIERFYRYADDNIRDAAYLRLNEVSLGYRIPMNLCKKALLRSLEVQLQARNLALWSANEEGIDPEAVNMLTNSFMFPQSKSFILGIKATF